MQQARRRVLGAAADAWAAAAAGGRFSGCLPLTARCSRCLVPHTQCGNEPGSEQLCSLRGWVPSAADAGIARTGSNAYCDCSSQQQQPVGYSRRSCHWHTDDRGHMKEEAGSFPGSIRSGLLPPSLPAAAVLAAAAPVEAAAADGFGPVVAAMQLIDGLHAATGLPWWATLSATAVGESPSDSVPSEPPPMC